MKDMRGKSNDQLFPTQEVIHLTKTKKDSNIHFYLFSILNYKTQQKAKWKAIQVNLLLEEHRQENIRQVTLRNNNRSPTLELPKLITGGPNKIYNPLLHIFILRL